MIFEAKTLKNYPRARGHWQTKSVFITLPLVSFKICQATLSYLLKKHILMFNYTWGDPYIFWYLTLWEDPNKFILWTLGKLSRDWNWKCYLNINWKLYLLQKFVVIKHNYFKSENDMPSLLLLSSSEDEYFRNDQFLFRK